MWAQQEQRSPARIVSEAGSLKSPGNQGRWIGEGWGMFFSNAALKGLPSVYGAHMNISFIIKVKILVFVKWSYMSSFPSFPSSQVMLIIEHRMVSIF